ncbi:HD domain-containing phosphohydrolase [Streptomyces sp. NPDC006527]|uniref:HD domain-containing phosphohydrolase n=1 Tax=Streptomyces sp. NPDC006527 TaxID=3364749 RepID=UPI0036D029D4
MTRLTVGQPPLALSDVSELRPAIATRLRCAARPLDLGRAEVSADVWGRPGPASIADMERLRIHTYWSRRVLERVPTLAPSAPAAAHHDPLDGSGYDRGDFGIRSSPTACLLAAVGVYAAPTKPQPHRNPCTVDEAVGQLTCEADSGTPDRAACGLVLRAAGGRRP